MKLQAEEFVPNYLIGKVLPDNIYSFENYKYYIEKYWNVILNYIEEHIEINLNYNYVPLYNGNKNYGSFCSKMKLTLNDSQNGDGLYNKKEDWFNYYKNIILNNVLIQEDYFNKIKISMEDILLLLIDFIIQETSVKINDITYQIENEEPKKNIIKLSGGIL